MTKHASSSHGSGSQAHGRSKGGHGKGANYSQLLARARRETLKNEKALAKRPYSGVQSLDGTHKPKHGKHGNIGIGHGRGHGPGHEKSRGHHRRGGGHGMGASQKRSHAKYQPFLRHYKSGK